MLQTILVVAAAWAFSAAVMGALFFLRRSIGNTGVVDAAWSLGVGVLAVAYAILLDGNPVSRLIMALLAGSWSLRLGLHILFDRVIGKKEDGRYLDLIAGWGSDAPRKLFLFFQYQAAFVVVFSLPLVPLALVHGRPRIPQMILAVLIWCVAIAGESLADNQLARWRREPANRGRTCRTGLWKYSRHPNYFFEWLHWWTYVILGATAPHGWITLLGPALMLLFLYRVTGIPYTEKQALKSRGEDYRRYQQTVSAFFPWFPRKGD